MANQPASTFHFTIAEAGKQRFNIAAAALAAAEKRLKERSDKDHTVVVYENLPEATVLAYAVTNRRIRCLVHELSEDKGIKGSRLDVDVTAQVLALELEELHDLANQNLSDNIDVLQDIGKKVLGRSAQVDWASLTAALHAFFGVSSVLKVTNRAWGYAKAMHGPKVTRNVRVQLTVSLELAIPDGVDVQDVIDELDYGFTSGIEGSYVLDSEITESSQG